MEIKTWVSKQGWTNICIGKRTIIAISPKFERKPMLVHRLLLRNMSDTEHTYQNYLPDTHVLAKDQSRIIRLLKREV